MHDNEKGTCILINAAILGDRNMIKKEAKIIKYKDLTKEIQCMWNVKTNQQQQGNWNHLKIMHKTPEQHTGKARTQELHRTVILGMAHMLQKVLM
jgi:hypothetical protein